MSVHPFEMISIPAFPLKPRKTGVTSVLDKGLGVREVEDLVATAGEWMDVVKFGWGTARVQPGEILEGKLKAYQDAGIACSTGGTFLEIAYSQNKVDEFLVAAGKLGFDIVEVSNGVHPMTQAEKLKLIDKVRKAGFRVWSEVGKKDPDDDAQLTINDRIKAVELELAAGSEKVILEARESGTVGIYDSKGKPVTELLNRVAERVGIDRIVFEAPQKSQQMWLIQHLGIDVNLGNVATSESIALATLRFGLRGDTFPNIHLKKIDVHTGIGLTGALEAKERGGVVVIVDALRASSTIVTALGQGMKAVKPVATTDDCVGEVTAGERGGHTLPGCDHANSPMELRACDYRGKTLTLTTTNGVECLMAASSKNTTVLIGTTINASAVARYAERLARDQQLPVTLLLSGRHNRETIEDALAAGEILRAIKGTHLHGRTLPEASDMVAAFESGRSGKNLKQLGFQADIEFCAQRDVYDVVPIWRNGLLVRHDSVMPATKQPRSRAVSISRRRPPEQISKLLTELTT